MANKIISFGNVLLKSDQSTADSMIVFKDVSHIAKYIGKPLVAPPPFRALLKAEHVDEVLYDDIYTLFLLLFKADTTPTIEKINIILKQLSIYNIDKHINVQAIRNSLHNIFTWRPGERILNPEFGSRLYTLLYEGITPETEERIMAEIRHNISEWEPRVLLVEVRDISTSEEHENNTIHLEVIFTIPSLSDEQYSYSFTYNRADSDNIFYNV